MRRFLTFALVFAAAGCSDGERNPPPVVSIISPELEVHGSGSVVIQVVVEGCMPETVQLLLDGEPLAMLVPPFQYTWDTTWAAEGPREIIARAGCGGSVGTSGALTIFVDRTPPEVVGRTPAPSSATAWVRDPIAVTFSEPVDLASASESIALRDSLGNVVPVTVAASEGGARLTLIPALPPGVEDTFTVEIGTGVRDLAGYPLVPPRGVWTFSYPEFFQPASGPLGAQAGYAATPDLAVDGSGEPIAVWRPGFFLSAFALTGRVVRETSVSAPWGLNCGVGVHGAHVFVTDSAIGSPGYEIRFQLLGDGSLSPAGPGVTDGSRYAFQPDVSFDSDGTPVVAWVEYDAPALGFPSMLRAAFLDGGVWNDRGTVFLNLDPTQGAVSPSVARDSQGRPAIAFAENGRVHLKRWDGSDWKVVGPGPIGPSGAGGPSLAFDVDEPYVAVTEAPNALRVYHLVDGAWTRLPGDPVRNPSLTPDSPAIAVAGPGRVVLAWTEGYVSDYPYSAGSLYVSEWNGSAWVPRGSALNRGSDYPAYAPALAVDAFGEPIVVWTEPVAPFASGVGWNLRLARANR